MVVGNQELEDYWGGLVAACLLRGLWLDARSLSHGPSKVRS